MTSPIITIHEKDNVAVALKDLKTGDELTLPDGEKLPVLTDVPFGHKLAIKEMAEGDTIVKYGEAIGQAKGKIQLGEWVHTHNLVSCR